jgi:serine/threonine protein phosphatase 1
LVNFGWYAKHPKLRINIAGGGCAAEIRSRGVVEIADFLDYFTTKPRASIRPRPGDRLVYAVGDVHGCLSLLDELVVKIARDALHQPFSAKPMLVFIGDYVDRGQDPKGVIDRIIGLKNSPAFEVRALKGNHEDALIRFLRDASTGPKWVAYGGQNTLASYGVIPPGPDADATEWEAARAALGEAMPRSHLNFLAGLELKLEVGDYIFVHAGLRPGVPIDEQEEKDLIWIRDDFLNARRPFDKVVVHGHTPTQSPHIDHRRIGIDTFAHVTGVLTAVRLIGEEQTILQVEQLGIWGRSQVRVAPKVN